MYEYRALVLRVIDGDSIHVELDLGLDVRIRTSLRLNGINAPELSTQAGPPSREYLIRLLGWSPSAPPVVMARTIKDRKEKYGRYLATLVLLDGTNVNERMIADGFAVPYAP